jgi:hypothetical protein
MVEKFRRADLGRTGDLRLPRSGLVQGIFRQPGAVIRLMRAILPAPPSDSKEHHCHRRIARKTLERSRMNVFIHQRDPSSAS